MAFCPTCGPIPIAVHDIRTLCILCAFPAHARGRAAHSSNITYNAGAVTARFYHDTPPRTVYVHSCPICEKHTFEFIVGTHKCDIEYPRVCDHCFQHMGVVFGNEGRAIRHILHARCEMDSVSDISDDIIHAAAEHVSGAHPIADTKRLSEDLLKIAKARPVEEGERWKSRCLALQGETATLPHTPVGQLT